MSSGLRALGEEVPVLLLAGSGAHCAVEVGLRNNPDRDVPVANPIADGDDDAVRSVGLRQCRWAMEHLWRQVVPDERVTVRDEGTGFGDRHPDRDVHTGRVTCCGTSRQQQGADGNADRADTQAQGGHVQRYRMMSHVTRALPGLKAYNQPERPVT